MSSTSVKRQQEALARLTRSALLDRDLSQVMDEAVSLVAEGLCVEFCHILELLPSQRTYVLAAGIGWRPGLVGRLTIDASLPSQVSHTILPHNSPVVVHDLRHDPRFQGPAFLLEHGVVGGVSVAITSLEEGRPSAVLGVYTGAPRAFSEEEVHFLEQVADILAAAVQRLRHQENLARFARIVETSQDAIIGKRLDGTITDWNRGAERIYGYTAQEMIGTSITRLFPPERRGELTAIFERLRRGEVLEPFETTRLNKHGEPIPVLVSISPLFDSRGTIIGASSIVRDISHLKDAQRRLEELTGTLEQRIAERTQELVASQNMLRQMASKLTLAELRERRRIATELHDYLAQLLVVGRLKIGQLRPTIEAQPARATLGELDQLLDQSLTYTRTLVAELSPNVLYELGLAAALKWLGRQMARHGLHVEVQVPHHEADCALPEDYAVLVYQAVRELLLNILKHADIGSGSVRLEKRTDQELRVVVADAGRGFDLSGTRTAQHTTDKFGLFSISERLKVLGGRFEIRSEPGKGTTATILVPIPERAQPQRVDAEIPLGPSGPARKKTRPPEKQIRIALVDDHTMVRQGLRSVLEGAEELEIVAEAEDGYEAVEMARTVQPDVVVMDVNLPKLNGIEATRRILSEHPSITVIGISVHDDEQIGRAVREAGAKAFLPKGSAASNLMREIYAARK